MFYYFALQINSDSDDGHSSSNDSSKGRRKSKKMKKHSKKKKHKKKRYNCGSQCLQYRGINVNIEGGHRLLNYGYLRVANYATINLARKQLNKSSK